MTDGRQAPAACQPPVNKTGRLPGVAEPAYRRLDVDERRRQLLELGEDLFARHAYDEISMADIARAAGISKALLYHYFPSKQAYFQATLAELGEELLRRTVPDPGQPPLAALAAVLDAYLTFIEEHAAGYAKLMQSMGAVSEVRELVAQIRGHTVTRILDGVSQAAGAPASPRARAAVTGWLWFMDGACLDWLTHRDFTREELRGQLMGTLVGALAAADASGLAGALHGASGPGAG